MTSPTAFRSRIRRTQPDCSSQVDLNPELQEAITKMITGNEAKGYLMKTPVAGNSNLGGKLDKAMCEGQEDEAADDISPDTPIRDRAVCAFQYVENFDPKVRPTEQGSNHSPTALIVVTVQYSQLEKSLGLYSISWPRKRCPLGLLTSTQNKKTC